MNRIATLRGSNNKQLAMEFMCASRCIHIQDAHITKYPVTRLKASGRKIRMAGLVFGRELETDETGVVQIVE